MRLMTSAKVTLTVEINAKSSWGPDCTIAQVHKQGAVDAIGFLERIARENPGTLKIIGTPDVKIVSAVDAKE